MRAAATTGTIVSLGAVANKGNVLLNVENVEAATVPVTNNWGSFLGTIKDVTPAQTYDRWTGTPDGNQFVKDKGLGQTWSSNKAVFFSGEKSGVADETTTSLCKFLLNNDNAFRVQLDVVIQNGSSANKFVLAETVSFVYTTDNGGVTTISTVDATNSTVALDGFSSAAVTWSAIENAGYVELQMNQNNEPFDSSAVVTYSGHVTGGVAGGNTNVGRFEPL